MSRRARRPAGVALLLGLLVPLVAVAFPVAREAAARPAQEPTDPLAGDVLSVVEQTPFVPDGGTFALRVRVADPPEGATLSWSLRGATTTRTAFLATLLGVLPRRVLARVGPVPLTSPLVDAEGTVLLQIPTAATDPSTAPVALAPGVYPLVLEVQDADGETVDRIVTHVVRVDGAPEAPLQVAIELPLHAAPAHLTLEGTTPVLDALEPTLDALAAHPTLPLALVPTPETLAAGVAEGGRSAFAGVAAGRQITTQPWVRLREGGWAAVGLGELATSAVQRGIDATSDALRAEPDRGIAVLVPGSSRADAQRVAERGATTVLVREGDLEPLGDDGEAPLQPTRLALDDAGTVTVGALVADDTTSTRHGRSGDTVLDGHHLLADLAVLAEESADAPRVVAVALDDAAAADEAFLAVLLGGLAPGTGLPSLLAVTPGSAVAAIAPAATGDGSPEVRRLARVEPTTPGPAVVDAARAASADASSYRGVFGAGDERGTAAVDVVLSAAAEELDEVTALQSLGAVRSALAADLRGIAGPPARQRFTLTAREGRIQLVFTNDTGRTADVLLDVAGERIELVDHPDGRVPLRLGESTVRVDLRLRALSSGDAPLVLRTLSPDGRVLLGEARVTVRTTAFSGVGLVLLGTALGFLVLWWTRTILRERRGSRRRHPTHASGR